MAENNSTQSPFEEKVLQELKALRKEVDLLRRQNEWLIDNLDPTLTNTQSIHQMVYNQGEDIAKIRGLLSSGR